jgi:hypothetical protein
LKSAYFSYDCYVHDDAWNNAAEVSHDGKQNHDPRNGRSACKRGVTGRLSGGAPVFSREELDRPRYYFLAGERSLLGENGIGHSVSLGFGVMPKSATDIAAEF